MQSDPIAVELARAVEEQHVAVRVQVKGRAETPESAGKGKHQHELLAGKPRQIAAGLFNLLNEAQVMRGDNGVESGLLRPMAVIGGSGRNRG